MRKLAAAGVLFLLGLAAQCAAAQTPSTPAGFWNAYFSGRFVSLQRDRGWWSGDVRVSGRGEGPGALTRQAPTSRLRISEDSLRRYDYRHDPRFALISPPDGNIAAAFDAVLEGTYVYRDAAPFGKVRMAELFALIRQRYHLRTVMFEGLERTFGEMLAARSAELNQPLAALAWFLGEQRQRSSSTALVELVRSSVRAPADKGGVHFTAVDAAFAALWKIDDKSRLPELLALMRESPPNKRRNFALLFERLLSTRELLSLHVLGDRWLAPEFWSGRLEPHASYSLAAWDEYDANSLFWEIRYLAAARLDPAAASLQMLTDDPVEPVRQLAQRRSTPR